MKGNAKSVAFGGVLAAVAVTVMALGGFIPVATYVCPMLCAIILLAVYTVCGKRIGWAWYAVVSLLSLLLSPDKEAAAVFVALGYYPLVQPKLHKLPCPWLFKAVLFNLATGILYLVLIYLMGMEHLISEFTDLGFAGAVVTLILGNISFFLLDFVLRLLPAKFRSK